MMRRIGFALGCCCVLAACGPDSWTVDGSTEPETIDIAPGETLERQVIYEGRGNFITIVASLEQVSPDAQLRIRQVDGDLPTCTAEGEFRTPPPGGVIELAKLCEAFQTDDRTIFIENVGSTRAQFVYRTRGSMHIERKHSSGEEFVKLTELRRGLPATRSE